MSGETNLLRLIATMDPQLLSRDYTWVTDPGMPEGTLLSRAFAAIREEEGWTLVLPVDIASSLGLGGEGPFRCITLRVHSSLSAVGLTAAVASALAKAGISANVVAAFHHDHVFVPAVRAEAAMEVLRALVGNGTGMDDTAPA